MRFGLRIHHPVGADDQAALDGIGQESGHGLRGNRHRKFGAQRAERDVRAGQGRRRRAPQQRLARGRFHGEMLARAGGQGNDRFAARRGKPRQPAHDDEQPAPMAFHARNLLACKSPSSERGQGVVHIMEPPLPSSPFCERPPPRGGGIGSWRGRDAASRRTPEPLPADPDQGSDDGEQGDQDRRQRHKRIQGLPLRQRAQP
jgi:hypothetical protein